MSELPSNPSYVDHVRSWQAEANASDDFALLMSQVEYFAQHLFKEYKPTKGPGYKLFLDRLSDWLNSATEVEDRQTMLKLVTHLLFVGSQEFDCLYQAAFSGPISRWLIKSTGLRFQQSEMAAAILNAESETWFCAVSDSMQISEFYHLNNIEGVSIRPSWRTLYQFGDEQLLQRVDLFLKENGFKRLVLLEDFVGSGTQMVKAVKFAASLPSKPPILFCPILACPAAISVAEQICREFDHMTFDPVVKIPAKICLTREPAYGESSFFKDLRRSVYRLQGRLVNPATDIGPFGFDDTGALVVMHTNTPDNSLPMLHHVSAESRPWSPLFRRSSRL